MTPSPQESSFRLRVGRLCVDPRSKEAWKDGNKLPLPHQSLEILVALMERSGEIVTREELRRRLWPEGTFVDFEHSLNAAVKKLRVALGDSAERPQFIETLPRVGYRLVGSGDSTPSVASTAAPFAHRTRPRMWITSAAVLLVLSGGAWLWVRSHRTAAPASRLSIQRLTSRGNVVASAISPDGKYFSYVTADDPTQSLWVQQVGIPNELLIRREERGELWGQKFSRDGRFIYYGLKTLDDPAGKLFRIPALGGEPQEILAGIDSSVSFSPDSSRIAFLRAKHPTATESALLTANADGTDIRVIGTRREPDAFVPIFFNAPSWSPDGHWIACSTRETGGSPGGTMLAFRVDGSEEKRLSDFPWMTAQQLEWLPDGSGLVAIATDEAPRSPQIWLVPFPPGAPERITIDLRQYRLVDLTADGRSLLTVAMERDSAIWRVPVSGSSVPMRITNFRLEISAGLAVTPDGDTLLGTYENGQRSLWVLSGDGTKRRPFRNTEARDSEPAVSPRASEVAFVTEDATGSWLAVAAIDGSRSRRIAPAAVATPAFSPDGKGIVFTSREGFLLKVPVGGGTPTRLTNFPARSPAVSPDGRWIAAFCGASGNGLDLCVVPFDVGRPVKRLARYLDPPQSLGWSANGKEVLAVGERDWANIHAYPLDGSPPRRVTSFADERMAGFALADRGEALLVIRTRLLRDAYLITGFRK